MKYENNHIPELSFLLKKVREKYGRGINTSTDFEALSITIEQLIGEYISASTLKRMFGYVSQKPTPRISTLDILAHYIGDTSFASFSEKLKANSSSDEAFFTTRYIVSDELEIGSKLILGWEPNRLVILEYEGDTLFKVLESKNSKLLVNDEFKASLFMIGYPLLVNYIIRDGSSTPSYIAGKIKGLNYMELVSPSSESGKTDK